MQEAAQRRIVDSRLVMIEPRVGVVVERDLAGVAEARTRPRVRLSEGVIDIGRRRAAIIGFRDDRAALVGIEPDLRAEPSAFIPDQRNVSFATATDSLKAPPDQIESRRTENRQD